LAWIFITIDYKDIWLAIKGSDMRYMSAAGIIFFLINFLMIWRWRILMKALGLKSRRLSSMRWFFIGLFSSLARSQPLEATGSRGSAWPKKRGIRPRYLLR